MTMVSVLMATISLTACAKLPAGAEFNDPNEADNRKIHKFNKGVDKALLSPASTGYAAIFSDFDDEMISNFVENAALPNRVVNNFLQGNLNGFLENTTRFFFNTTFGIGGLFDVSTNFGLPNDDTDFGETLHVWGSGEGKYMELPFFGGSTERDALGIIVDTALDPLGTFLTPLQSNQLRGVKLLEAVGDRHAYGSIIESVLYDADDSYSTQRQWYLQNRRFNLNGEIADTQLENPYAE